MRIQPTVAIGVLIVRIQNLLARSGEFRARAMECDAKRAPPSLVEEVQCMADEIVALSDHCSLLRERLGEKSYLGHLRAASLAAPSSERLLENEASRKRFSLAQEGRTYLDRRSRSMRKWGKFRPIVLACARRR